MIAQPPHRISRVLTWAALVLLGACSGRAGCSSERPAAGAIEASPAHAEPTAAPGPTGRQHVGAVENPPLPGIDSTAGYQRAV